MASASEEVTEPVSAESTKPERMAWPAEVPPTGAPALTRAWTADWTGVPCQKRQYLD